MTDLRDVLAVLARREPNLFALDPLEHVRASDDVHGHLLAPIILLATRDDVLAKVFPADGSVHGQALYDLGVDPVMVKEDPHLKKLMKYRSSFVAIQLAWLDLTGYQDPPCLDDGRIKLLVEFTKTLAPGQP